MKRATAQVDLGLFFEQPNRKESGELRKAMSDLETKNRTLAVNLQQREADFKQKAAAVEVRLRSFHCSAAPC